MQDTREITFYPGLDLSSVGKTPAGEPLFRVVLAPTRLDAVIVKETGALQQMPAYLHDGWMLEKWQSAQEFYGMTPEAYEQAANDLGFAKRYQPEGEYDAVHPFKNSKEVGFADLYARMAQYGKEHLTLAERRQIIEWHQKQEEKRVAAERRDIIAEAAPSRFGRVAERVQLYDADGRTMQV